MQPYYQASKQMNEAIVEYISGMEVIKVFGQTSASFRKYGESVKRYRQPDPYKQLYEIYPSSMGKTDVAGERRQLEQQIRALGRIPQ